VALIGAVLVRARMPRPSAAAAVSAARMRELNDRVVRRALDSGVPPQLTGDVPGRTGPVDVAERHRAVGAAEGVV
jgi:hypothetical protein